jgi:hypothetical protein
MTSRTATSRVAPGGGRARSRKPAGIAVAPATAPSAPVSDAKIGSLKRLNDGVEHARASTDLLYRLITEPSGTDLRALVARIKTHVCGMANELRIDQQRTALANEQQKRLAASFTQKPIVDDDLQCLNHLFDKLCGLEVNANDDKARIAQLACVFSILTTDIDIRRQLVGTDAGGNNDDDDRKAANLIDRSALTLFLQHDARQLMTSYRDGNMTALDYVDRCVTAYLSYLPTLTPRVARNFFCHRRS